MLFSKIYKNILRDNSSYKYMILCLLLGIVLIVSTINRPLAYDGPESVEDLKAELDMLDDNECAIISKGLEDGSYIVEVTTGFGMIYLPVKVKADVVAERVKSGLEKNKFVIVTRANDDGYFYVFNPESYGGSGMYGDGMYDSMLSGTYDRMLANMIGSTYGSMLGGTYGGMYGYGYGYDLSPMWSLSGLLGLYVGNMQGINTGLYGSIGGYGNSLYLNNNSANGFISPFYNGYPMSIGYSDLMLNNFLTTLLLSNVPLYNRPTAIPSETDLVRDKGVYRKAHELINPVFPGSTVTPGFLLLNLTSAYPMSTFQDVRGRFY